MVGSAIAAERPADLMPSYQKTISPCGWSFFVVQNGVSLSCQVLAPGRPGETDVSGPASMTRTSKAGVLDSGEKFARRHS